MNEKRQRAVGAIAWGVLAALFFIWRAPGFAYLSRGNVDNVYQIALGQQAFGGGIPGVGYFTQYGPAIGWMSALNWWTGHAWLAEVVSWCLFLAAGYGALWWWVAPAASITRRACVLAPAFLFTPHFAKYYFIFFPALLLALLGDGVNSVAVTRKTTEWRWVCAGLVAGVAGLFRIELGLALTVAGAAFLGFDEMGTRGTYRAALTFTTGAVLVGSGYLLFLIVAAHDLAAAWSFVDFQWTVTLAKIDVFSRNEVSLHGMFQRNAAGTWGLVALAVFYVGVAAAGLRSGWRDSWPRRIWAAGLLGCALLPHAMHNTGVSYDLQVGLPACACIAACCLCWWDRAPGRVNLVLVLLVAAGLGLRAGRPNYGYVGWTDSLPAKIAALWTETPKPDEIILLSAAVDRLAGDDGLILIPSLNPGVYALVHHRWAGLFPHLVIPMPERWQEMCIEHLRRQPPMTVLLPSRDGDRQSRVLYYDRNPLIEQFIRRNYEVADKSVPGWVLLRPNNNLKLSPSNR